jgi:hypothetical protein
MLELHIEELAKQSPPQLWADALQKLTQIGPPSNSQRRLEFIADDVDQIIDRRRGKDDVMRF